MKGESTMNEHLLNAVLELLVEKLSREDDLANGSTYTITCEDLSSEVQKTIDEQTKNGAIFYNSITCKDGRKVLIFRLASRP